MSARARRREASARSQRRLDSVLRRCLNARRLDVLQRHVEHFLAAVAIESQRGLVDGQKTKRADLVHEHDLRIGLEQFPVARLAFTQGRQRLVAFEPLRFECHGQAAQRAVQFIEFAQGRWRPVQRLDIVAGFDMSQARDQPLHRTHHQPVAADPYRSRNAQRNGQDTRQAQMQAIAGSAR
jgi:hypothetical protein